MLELMTEWTGAYLVHGQNSTCLACVGVPCVYVGMYGEPLEEGGEEMKKEEEVQEEGRERKRKKKKKEEEEEAY